MSREQDDKEQAEYLAKWARGKELLEELKAMKKDIGFQAFSTIRGQIKAGDLDGARVGMDRLKKKLMSKASDN